MACSRQTGNHSPSIASSHTAGLWHSSTAHVAEPGGFTEPGAAVDCSGGFGVFIALGCSRRAGEPGRSAYERPHRSLRV